MDMLTLRDFPSRALPVLAGALLSLAATLPAWAQPVAADIRPETIGGEPVVEIAAGGNHSCARVQSGLVYCWGYNVFGQLGDGTTDDRLTPVQVADLTGATQIAVGEYHSCALRSTARVFCWGYNGFGQLGDGSTEDRWTRVRVAEITDVTQIATGTYHSCALRTSGRVFCWGQNANGQLGDGTTDPSPTPVRVQGAWSTGATQIAAGGYFSCLLRQTGRVACWGDNTYNQLGDGTNSSRPTPGPVTGLTSVTQIDSGDYHSCGLRSNGRVFCWGYNSWGALGDGTTTVRLVPVRVRDLTGATQVAAGGYWGTGCAVRNTGRIFCWGYNGQGQLGNGNLDASSIPVRVQVLTGSAQVSVGLYHVCGLRADGRAYCWGSNGNGRLGDGTTENRSVPVQVAN